MRIAIATANFARVTGHAGRARKWLVFDIGPDGAPGEPSRVELAADQVFHHVAPGTDHPLDGVDAVITHSAGDGFQRKMLLRGIAVGLTAETDPARAAAAYLAGTLPPPKPRPIGQLVCKAIDALTHKP